MSLRSDDPYDMPKVDIGFLTDKEGADLATLRCASACPVMFPIAFSTPGFHKIACMLARLHGALLDAEHFQFLAGTAAGTASSCRGASRRSQRWRP